MCACGVTPFFEQLYNQTNLKYTGAGTTTQTIGRVDLAFLRCCDRDGDKEVGVVLHYFRMLYSFNPAAAQTALRNRGTSRLTAIVPLFAAREPRGRSGGFGATPRRSSLGAQLAIYQP